MSSVRLQMNLLEQTQVVLMNFTKMLWRRRIITENQVSEIYQKLFDQKPDNGKYNLKVNEKNLGLLLYFNPLTSVKKGSDVEEFMLIKKDLKFVIAKSISKKTVNQGKERDTEIFEITELLVDIPANPLVPEHILLDDKEKEEFLKIYQEKNLPKLFSDDIMSRYLGGKKGDIIKIIRKTINSGNSVYYRRVV